MSKWSLNDLDILEYKEDKVALKNLFKNGEDKIGDLNREINRIPLTI